MNSTKTTHFDSTCICRQLVLALLILSGLCLTGCSNRMAIMQENQANLQILVQENAHQMSALVTCMEQSQQALKATIQDLRETTRELSEDMTQVTASHTDLKKTVQQTNQVIAGRMTSIQEDQKAVNSELFSTAEARRKLATSIVNEEEKRLALEDLVQDNKTVFMAKLSTAQGGQVELRSQLKSLKDTVQVAVDDISAVAMAQQTLQETVSKTVASQLAAMQEIQSQQQTQLDFSQDQIEELLNGLTGLSSNLTELERILKEDISNVSKAVELTAQKTQGQNDLAQQVANLQSNTDAMFSILKDELSEVRIVVAEIQTLEMNDAEILSPEEAAP
jgi:chromosome segregation ATPase